MALLVTAAVIVTISAGGMIVYYLIHVIQALRSISAKLANARILLHQPYGQSGYAQASDLELVGREIIRMRDMMNEIVARHTGQSVERVHKDTDRDFVMSAEEAKEYGIIDEVITDRTDVDTTAAIK